MTFHSVHNLTYTALYCVLGKVSIRNILNRNMFRNRKIERNSSLVDDDKSDKTVKIVDIQRLIKLKSGQVERYKSNVDSKTRSLCLPQSIQSP